MQETTTNSIASKRSSKEDLSVEEQRSAAAEGSKSSEVEDKHGRFTEPDSKPTADEPFAFPEPEVEP